MILSRPEVGRETPIPRARDAPEIEPRGQLTRSLTAVSKDRQTSFDPWASSVNPDRLIETARGYGSQATAENTRRACAEH